MKPVTSLKPVTSRPPHGGQMILQAGAPLHKAEQAMIMVHGRGASAQNILALAAEFEARDIAFLAPQAAGGSWYPYSFLAPVEHNEPGRSSGLALLRALLERLETEHDLAPSQVFLLGFSQGACLTLELAARHPQRFAGVIGLTGGLIGPPGDLGDFPGSLAGTPVFLGAGDPDPHVPWERVEQTAEILRQLGAEVLLERYPGLPHGINDDEIAAIRRLLRAPRQPAELTAAGERKGVL